MTSRHVLVVGLSALLALSACSTPPSDNQPPPDTSGPDAGSNHLPDAGEPDDVDAGKPDDVDAGEPDDVDAGEPDEPDAGEPETPAPFSPEASQFEASKSEAVADGMDGVELSFTVVDTDGEPMEGVLVVVESSSDSVTVSGPEPTDAEGRTSAFVTTTRMQSVTVSARVDSDVFPQTFELGFVPGPAARAAFTTTEELSAVVGTTPLVLSGQVVDAFDNPVADVALLFEVSGSDNDFDPSGTSDENGSFTFEVSSTKAETKQISLQAGELGDALEVTFVAGPVSADDSSVSLSADESVANGRDAITVSIEARDAFQNPAVGAEVSVLLDGAEAAGQTLIDGDGEAIVSLIATVPGQKDVEVRVGGLFLDDAEVLYRSALSVTVKGLDEGVTLSLGQDGTELLQVAEDGRFELPVTWVEGGEYEIVLVDEPDQPCEIFDGRSAFTDLLADVRVVCGALWQDVGLTSNSRHVLAIRKDGTLWAWGANDWRQLGVGNTTTTGVLQQVMPDKTFTSVSAGTSHSLALDTTGAVWVFGHPSTLGGDGRNGDQIHQVLNGVTGIKSVHAGDIGSSVLATNGIRYVWGKNGSGQLGTGMVMDQTTPSGRSDGAFVDVKLGPQFGLARDTNEEVWSWGSNSYGQLGRGNTSSSYSPAKVPTLSGTFVDIAAGPSTGYAVKSDGTLWSWGRNDYGQLGTESTSAQVTSAAMLPTPEGVVFTSVTAGTHFAAALDEDGAVWMWGDNSSGVFGHGDFVRSTVPVRVYGERRFKKIVAGHSIIMALTEEGRLFGWGKQGDSQLGVVERITSSFHRVGTGFTQVKEGDTFGVGLKADGSLWGWGRANDNQLLDAGSLVDKPRRLMPDKTFHAVEAGHSHVLAIESTGRLWAWGLNDKGQLGVEGAASRGPVELLTSSTIVAIGAYSHTSHAIDSDGKLWGWGSNGSYDIGLGTTGNRFEPTEVAPDTSFQQVFGGDRGGFALDVDGKLWGWGWGKRIGDGTTYSRLTPAAVKHDTTFSRVESNYHTLAIDSDGHLWAWGENGNYVLGDGTTTDDYNPKKVFPTQTFRDVALTSSMSAAVTTEGELWLWGRSSYGLQGMDVGDSVVTTPTWRFPEMNVQSVFLRNAKLTVLDTAGTVWRRGLAGNATLGVELEGYFVH